MKKVFFWLAGVAVAMLTIIASAGAVSACHVMLYEPEVPDKLRVK